MKISDIIFSGEYLSCDVDLSHEFKHLKTSPEDLKEEDILIIANSSKMPKLRSLSIKPVAVICDKNLVLPDNIHSIRVSNPRLAMSKAFFRYESPCLENMKIVGITGTNGKTTTATLIANTLSTLSYKVGFIGTGKIEIDREIISNENYSMTTPDPSLLYRSLRRMSDYGCNAVVMEVSSHALALEKVAPITFDYGIFTNLSPEHMDFHGEIESYFAAKQKLFNQCRCAIINIDDKRGRALYDLCDTRKISVGILWPADVCATNIHSLGFWGTEYTYCTKDFTINTNQSLPGSFNLYNSLIAATACIDIGCNPKNVFDMIGKINTIPGRYEIINSDISVIIDYAHTPEAFNSILSDIHAIKGTKRLTVVFGCGGDRDKTKRPRMAKISEKYADRIILTSDNSRNENTADIIDDIIKGFEYSSYEVIEDRSLAITDAIVKADDGDIVAVIGKGAEKYNIDKAGYHPFDEKSIINSALQQRNHKLYES